jgi:hypothetical protein
LLAGWFWRAGCGVDGKDMVVGRDEALLALQGELTGRVFEFATVLEVVDGGADGFVLRWGRRVTLDGGIQAIDPSLEPGPPSPWWVSVVSLQRPTRAGQRRLRRLARRVGDAASSSSETASRRSPARHQVATCATAGPMCSRDARPTESRLVAWLLLFDDDSADATPVGPLVVS